MPTEFENNWMTELGPRYRRLSERGRIKNPLPKVIDPQSIGPVVEKLRSQESLLGRLFSFPSQEPLPLNWEKHFAHQLYDSGAKVEIQFRRVVRRWLFRRGIRRWMRYLIILALICLGFDFINTPLLLKAPDYQTLIDHYVQKLDPEMKPMVLQGTIMYFFIYFASFIPSISIKPSRVIRKGVKSIRYLCSDGIMMKNHQLIQWSGMEIKEDFPERFHIILRDHKSRRVLLSINTTIVNYIPIYLFVKKCISKS
jgi:hypothetical protein